MEKIELTTEQSFVFARLKSFMDKAKTLEDMKKLCEIYAKHFVILQSTLSSKQVELNQLSKELFKLEEVLKELAEEVKCRT